MPEYRFYRIDRRGHRLGPPEVADCANDDEAVAYAKRVLTGYVLEVCQADRMVKHLSRKFRTFAWRVAAPYPSRAASRRLG